MTGRRGSITRGSRVTSFQRRIAGSDRRWSHPTAPRPAVPGRKNNLDPSLASYGGLVGRRVERWHGDIDLRAKGVATFVSHSSLGTDERRRAETAFAQGSNCVIVATSTLELGIDVGDLDRVIQVDAPSTFGCGSG